VSADLGRWSSPALPDEGRLELGAWRARWTSRPWAGEAPGGDRFVLELSAEGGLCFAVADAAGHGARGNALWERHAAVFAAGWRAFVDGAGFPELFDPLDASLCEVLEHSLCLTAGRWSPGGALELATCGYGTHALVTTAAGPWWTEAEQLFGLKLGWFGPERRRELPRGLVRNELVGVERVILLSDGLLPDDHRDPEATLSRLEAANARCASLPPAEVISSLLEEAPTPPEDDQTVVVLERAASPANQ